MTLNSSYIRDENMEVNNMYVEPVRGMSAAQTKQTVQMTTDTDNTIHAQSTEGEAEYTT